MKTAKLTCIMCPVGCELTVTEDGQQISVSGNTCVRGERYGKEEITSPKRVLTALVRVGDGVLPVKTSVPIPKSMLFSVMEEINRLHLKSAKLGDIVLKNVLSLGVDIVVTGNQVNYDL